MEGMGRQRIWRLFVHDMNQHWNNSGRQNSEEEDSQEFTARRPQPKRQKRTSSKMVATNLDFLF